MKLQIVAIVAGVSACVWAGHEWGKSGCLAEHQAAEIDRQNAELVAEVRRHGENQAINSIIRRSYAEEISAVTGQSAEPVRLRIPTSVCPGARVPPVRDAASAGRGDAAAAGTGPLHPEPAPQPLGEGIDLPADLSARMTGDAEEADKVVASCRALQEFVRRNGLTP